MISKYSWLPLFVVVGVVAVGVFGDLADLAEGGHVFGVEFNAEAGEVLGSPFGVGRGRNSTVAHMAMPGEGDLVDTCPVFLGYRFDVYEGGYLVFF